MNKYIYLFELDSVCSSLQQIQHGQNKLFEETLINGNFVVLSYNQLTDSKAFLAAVYNDVSYYYIVELFKIGVIKVTPYNDIRTASQYIQQCIDRCLSDDEDIFLFSGVPVYSNDDNRTLLKKINRALKYSDIGILEEELKSNPNDAALEFIIRYIRLILILSVENLAKLELTKRPFQTLSNLLKIISNHYHVHSLSHHMNFGIHYDLLKLALDILSTIENEILSFSQGINNRSVWIKVLNNLSNQPSNEASKLCEIIINLAYNYTIQENIDKASKKYLTIGDDVFFQDFEKRMNKNWFSHLNGDYSGYQSDKADITIYDQVTIPEWSTANRILSKVHTYKTINSDINNTHINRFLWRKKLYRYFLMTFLTTAAYIGVFVLTEQVVDLLKEFLSQYYETLFDKISNTKYISQIINVIVSTVIFGLFGSYLAKIFRLPDILEGIASIYTGIKDLIIILRYFRKTINEAARSRV